MLNANGATNIDKLMDVAENPFYKKQDFRKYLS